MSQRQWWKRPVTWVAIVLLVVAAVSSALLFVRGQSGAGWTVAIVSAGILLVWLAPRSRDYVLEIIGDVIDWLVEAPRRARRFYGTEAPGSSVPVLFWLAGFAVALATAYYLPRSFPDFAHAQHFEFFVLLGAGQIAGQAFAYRLTRPSAGDLVYLRHLATPTPVMRRGTPARPTHPDDVVRFFLSRFPAGRPVYRYEESVVRDLGPEWRRPFKGRVASARTDEVFPHPLDLLSHFLRRFPHGMDEIDADLMYRELKMYERSYVDVRARPEERIRALFAPRAAAEANEQLVLRAGFVVDDAWSRLKVVLPAGLRLRHLLTESIVIWTRLVVAVAMGWVVFFAVFLSWFALLPLVVIGWAVWAGRRQLVRAYEMRAATADIYRFELAERMRVALPASQSEFAQLGPVFTGGQTEWELVPAQNGNLTTHVHHGDVNAEAADTSRLEEQLADTRQGLTIELHRVTERLKDAQDRLSELTDRQLSAIPDLVARSVGAAVSAPPMVNFTGYLAIEDQNDESLVDGNTIMTTPAAQVGVVVSVLADARARDSAPERGTEDDRFLALQPLHIDGGRTEPEVEFELVVDSATVRPSPRRHQVRVARPTGQSQVPVSLLVPDQDGRHEVWLQLFQSGQLVQMVMIIVEARRE